jgi:hypothetical protein
LDPQTGVSRTAQQINNAKNISIRISERIARITDFIHPPNPINFGDFTLIDGTRLEDLANQVGN